MSENSMGDALAQVMSKGDEVRSQTARLLNCSREDISLLHSTTEGLSLVALGLDWRAGDEVISYELEHPNAVYPWMNLRDRGVKVRFVPDRGLRFELSDLEELVNARTRVICLSLVNFAHGFRAPLESVGEICRRNGIWFVVDAVQAIGALKVDAAALGADIISAHGYKWLMSGFGLSVCYCSPRARRELRVAEPGWMSRREPADVSALLKYDLDFTSEARRFEPSEPQVAALHGLGASLHLIEGLGVDVIEARIRKLREDIATGLQERGYQVVSSARPGETSNIVSAARDAVDARVIETALNDARVSCSIREGRVRVAPHFYNNADDVTRLLSCLP